jgi:hypothetical protein
MKYSKSGAILPITKAVIEKKRFGKYPSGNTAPGCEKVKGIN